MPYSTRALQVYEDARGIAGFSAPDDQVLGALFDQVYSENAMVALARQSSMDQSDFITSTVESRRGTKSFKQRKDSISSDEVMSLSQEYGVEVTPSEGRSETYWRILLSERQRTAERDQIRARADETLGMGSQLAVTLGAALADPGTLISLAIPGVREANVLRMSAGATKAAGRFGLGVAEGVLYTAPLEIAGAGALMQQQADYDMMDAVLSVTLAGALGGIGRTIGGKISDTRSAKARAKARAREEEVRKGAKLEEIEAAAAAPVRAEPTYIRVQRERLARMSDEDRLTLVRTAVSQVMQGRPLTAGNLLDLDVMADPDLSRFTREELELEVQAALDEQFAATRAELEEVGRYKINRKERKELEQELKGLEYDLKNLASDADYKRLARGAVGPKAKAKQVIKKAKELRAKEQAAISARMARIDEILANNKRANQARERLNVLGREIENGTLSAAAIRRAQQIQIKLAQMPERIQRFKEDIELVEIPARVRANVERVDSTQPITDDDAHPLESLDGARRQLEAEGDPEDLAEADALSSELDSSFKRVREIAPQLLQCAVGS